MTGEKGTGWAGPGASSLQGGPRRAEKEGLGGGPGIAQPTGRVEEGWLKLREETLWAVLRF